MLLLTSLLLGTAAILLLIDYVFLTAELYRFFPEFTATAASFVGLVIAGLKHRDMKKARKSKKKRRPAMFIICWNLVICIMAAGLWLYLLFAKA